MLGFSEFNFGASLSGGVWVQGCDRAWRVEGITELNFLCWIANFRFAADVDADAVGMAKPIMASNAAS